jgi:DNA-binding GntR family transcriptional regulator
MKGQPQGMGSRTHAVYRALRRAIIEQALAPGTKLPEDAIGERFGVSRTLVREAFGRLASDGLIELKPNRGANVAYPSLEEARDVFAVRLGLERLVVETLAGRLGAQERARLESHLAAEDAARGCDEIQSMRLAGEFHILLAELTGNLLLVRYVSEVASRCSLILAIYGRPHSGDCAVSEHREIIESLVRGDATRAVAIMEHHLGAVMGRALLPPRGSRDIGEVLDDYARIEGLRA